MQPKDIRMQDSFGGTDTFTLEDFRKRPTAGIPLGKLFIALCEENTWSAASFTVTGRFANETTLVIWHPAFLRGRALVIDEACGILTVDQVEAAVRKHLEETAEWLLPTIKDLSDQRERARTAERQIDIDKAKALVVARYPEAADTRYRHAADMRREFHPFAKDKEASVYVVRQLGDAFVGPVKVRCTPFDWHCAGHEVRGHPQYKLFWEALAVQFAARELEVPEEKILSGIPAVRELPWQEGQVGGLRIEKVHVSIQAGRLQEFIVEFDENNLPARLTKFESETA